MKKFTKLFLSCAAVAAVTAAVATSAMAEEVAVGDFAKYDTDNGKISITNVPSDADATKPATLLVFDATADATNIPDTAVVGIDQTTAGTAFENSGLKDKPQQDGGKTYNVWLGYYTTEGFAIKKAVLFSTGEPIKVGDANLDGNIKAGDATAVLWYGINASKSAKVGTTINLSDGTKALVGDANLDGNIKAGDATSILWYGINDSKSAKVGTTITGTVVDAPAAE